MASGISIKIDDELLRNIHVRAAQKGVSVQQYMNGLIERDLFPERFPQLTGEQTQQLKTALELVNQALEGVDVSSSTARNIERTTPEITDGTGEELTLLQCVDKLNRMHLFPELFPHLNAEQLEQLSSAMETISQASCFG